MKIILSTFLSFCLISYGLANPIILENGAGSVTLPSGYTNIKKPGGSLRPLDATNAVFIKGDERVDFATEDEGKLTRYAEKYFPETKIVLSKTSTVLNGVKVNIFIWRDKLTKEAEASYKKIEQQRNKRIFSKGGAVVSYPELKVDFSCDYLDAGHLANFMLIALSYKPQEEQKTENTEQDTAGNPLPVE